MTRFVTSLAAGSLLLLAAGAAAAADLNGPRLSIKDSEPGAPYRACSGDRFAGAYLGGNIGLTNLNSKWEETFADFDPDYQDSPLKTTRSRGSVGLTAGYNWVRCNFLIGIEGDYNFTGVGGSTNHFPNQASLAGPGSALITDSMRNFATLRGRLGFVAHSTLFYATGGLAWANLKHRLDDLGHFNGGSPIPQPDFNGWKQGWAVGGGFEHALTEMISLKGEALYMDFGKRNYSFVDSAVPADFYSFQTRSNVVTARLGINFKLGAPPRSVSRCEDGGDNCCPDGRSPAKGGHCPLK